MTALYDAYDLVRLAIETRKDQIDALDWTVRPRRGDIEGWRRQIEDGAKELGVLLAKIQDDRLVFSDADRWH